MKETTLVITYRYGMHARPATILVGKANAFRAKVTLHYRGEAVNMKSIMGVMSLGIPPKAPFRVVAEGVDEIAAIAAIEAAVVDINTTI